MHKEKRIKFWNSLNYQNDYKSFYLFPTLKYGIRITKSRTLVDDNKNTYRIQIKNHLLYFYWFNLIIGIKIKNKMEKIKN